MKKNIDELKDFGRASYKEAMHIIGISARTSNINEMQGDGVIPDLWRKFLTEKMYDQIPNRIDEQEIIAVYHDIESDDRGPYNFFLGTRVADSAGVPEGMIGITVPAGEYLEILTPRGPFDKIGLETWQKVWASEDFRRRRRFAVDYEVYRLEDVKPDESQFRIVIGVQ